MPTSSQGSKPTVPLDPHSNDQQQIKKSNLNKHVQATYASGAERHSFVNDNISRFNKKIGANQPDFENTSKEKKNIPNIIAADTISRKRDLLVANKEGTLESVPLEKLYPKDKRGVISRDINKYDTSISGPGILDDLSQADKDALNNLVETDSVSNLFPWKKILGFNSSGKGVIDIANSALTKKYIIENFYSDWYSNIVLIVGTCFFAWLFGYIGLSWWSLGLVFFGTTSVYNAEYRRFNRNIRDDLKRITVVETMSGKVETTLWLNSFLSKFWVIYMPILSQQVKDFTNPILAGVVPGYGIDALTLEEFTLGSKAPAIKGIKSYTKAGKDVVEMDWSFAFTPNDVSDMTPIEAKEKINPKISLGVTLGKSIVSKTLSVLVENINVAGKLRVKLTFGKTFPNIKIVSVQLLEPPLIDFVLKPLGGDTLGIDVMSFLPGLKTFVKKIIDSNAGPMLYAPNHMDIDVEEIMAAQSNEAIGVIAVTVSSASNLIGSDFITNTVDPYVVLKTEKSLPNQECGAHTTIKSDTKNPVWNETKYILINSLDQKLSMTCWDFNDVRKDQIIGSMEFDMNTLYQTPIIENASKNLLLGSKTKGTLEYSIHYYPVVEKAKKIEPQEASNEESMEEESIGEEQVEESGAGILKFTLQKIKYLPITSQISNSLSPSVELFLDKTLVKSYRILKRINEPSWNELQEFLVISKEKSKLTLKVFDNRASSKILLCSYSSIVEDLITASEAGQDSFKASPQGEIFFVAQWKPLKMTGVAAIGSSTISPLGSMKIHVGSAVVRSTLSGIGDIDPYFTISLNKHVKYKSEHISDTDTPEFNSTVYVPITSENQILSLSLADYQTVGADRKIGSIQFPVSSVLQKNEDSKGYSCKHGFSSKPKTYNLFNKNNAKTADTINLGFEFINTMQIYSAEELKEVEILENELNAKKEEFEKTQAKYREEMKKNPDDWHIVEIKDIFEEEENRINSKEKMSFEELINHNSGILSISISKGKIPFSFYLQVLVDNIAYPICISNKYIGGSFLSTNTNVMIRDLKNSKLLFRVTKKKVVKDKDDFVSEVYLSTLDLLKNGFDKPAKIEFKNASLEVGFNYYPTYQDLPIEETVMNTGILSLKLISASHLMAADRNGKSDPFVEVYIDGLKAFKSRIIKKTLDPIWNETVNLIIQSKKDSKVMLKLLDWDRAGDNDYLGEVMLDTKGIIPNKTQTWEYPLNTQGAIKIQTTFIPEYIKPKIKYQEKRLTDTTPLKAIGTVGGVVGSTGTTVVTGVASGGIKASGHVFKTVGANKLLPTRRSLEKTKSRNIIPSMTDNTSVVKDVNMNHHQNMRSSSNYHRHNSTNNSTVANDDHTVNYPKYNVLYDKGTHISNNNATPTDDAECLRNKGKSINSHHNKFSIPTLGGVSHLMKGSNQSVRSSSSSNLSRGHGKISILAAKNLGKNVSVRVTLIKGEQRDEIFKTGLGKWDSNGSCYYQAQSAHFSSIPDGVVEFEALELHKLKKDKSIGTGKVSLTNPEIKDNKKASVDVGTGRIIFQIQYQP